MLLGPFAHYWADLRTILAYWADFWALFHFIGPTTGSVSTLLGHIMGRSQIIGPILTLLGQLPNLSPLNWAEFWAILRAYLHIIELTYAPFSSYWADFCTYFLVVGPISGPVFTLLGQISGHCLLTCPFLGLLVLCLFPRHWA